MDVQRMLLGMTLLNNSLKRFFETLLWNASQGILLFELLLSSFKNPTARPP